jgi:hypothetical protein
MTIETTTKHQKKNNNNNNISTSSSTNNSNNNLSEGSPFFQSLEIALFQQTLRTGKASEPESRFFCY